MLGKIFCPCYVECFDVLKITVFNCFIFIKHKSYDNGELVKSLDFFFPNGVYLLNQGCLKTK